MAKRAAASAAGNDLTTARVVLTKGEQRLLMIEKGAQARKALEAQHGEAAVFTYDGATADIAEIVDELRSLGLMASAKVVVVENVEELLRVKDEDEQEQQGRPGHGAGPHEGRREPAAPPTRTAREVLTEYVLKPEPTALLLLRTGPGKWSPGKFEEAVAQGGGVVEACDGPRESPEAWCAARAKAIGAAIEPEAARLLVATTGTNLARLQTELEKLAVTAVGQQAGAITVAMVRSLVGATDQDEEIWEVQRHLLSGNAEQALGRVRSLVSVSRLSPTSLMVALLDLARKLDGASRGLAAREPQGQIGARLKLWGPSSFAIMAVAARLRPGQTAEFLAAAVEGDVGCKSGGNAMSILEGLTVRLSLLIRSAPPVAAR